MLVGLDDVAVCVYVPMPCICVEMCLIAPVHFLTRWMCVAFEACDGFCGLSDLKLYLIRRLTQVLQLAGQAFAGLMCISCMNDHYSAIALALMLSNKVFSACSNYFHRTGTY